MDGSLSRRLRSHRCSGQTRSLVEPEREVHALHGRSPGALGQIVDRARGYNPPRSRVYLNLEVAHVRSDDVLRLRLLPGREQEDKGLPGVRLLVCPAHCFQIRAFC